MAVLKGLSFNVRSIQSQLRRVTVFNFLAAFNVTVLFLQECAIPHLGNYENYAKDWTYGPFVWSGSNENRSAGVAILFKGPVKIQTVQEILPGRALFVSVFIDGVLWNLLNVYASPEPKERIELFETLYVFMASFKPTILAGDFNCVLNEFDRYGLGIRRADRSAATLIKNIVNDFKYKDAFMCLHQDAPIEKRITWKSSTFGSRLDYVFISKSFTPLECMHEENIISDHKVVCFNISSPAEQKVGRGFWKLNSTLLKDKIVYDDFSKVFKVWQQENVHNADILTWWEIVKERIKRYFIKLGVLKAKEKREFYENLNTHLQTLYMFKDIGCDVDKEISIVKQSIKNSLDEKARNVIFKTRVQHVEENEKCTRYFFRKIESSRELITEIEGEKSRGGILKHVFHFYQNLYSTKNIDSDFMEDALNDITLVLNHDDANGLNDFITEKELFDTIQSFKRNKVPGLDGIPIEFYVRFWDILKDDLLCLFNKCFYDKKLPASWQKGVISMLPKEGDKTDFRNWRPITLLNTDYKILAKVFANRLKEVLGQVIHTNQVCGIPGRTIHQMTNLIRDGIWYVKDRGQQLAILSLDFEKAFDRISHVYLFNVLKKMGIPEGFLSSLRAFYDNCTSQVLVNGFMTECFNLKCGVKQGCPLSPLLFICAIEPLLLSIRRDKMIRGVHVPGGGGLQAKVTGYMDDITILCTDVLSIKRAVQRTEHFCAASGLRLNFKKSCMLTVGDWDSLSDCPIQQRESVKILGMVFNSQNDGDESWNMVLENVNGLIISWTTRHLTMEGKVLLIKMVLMLILLYTALTYPPSMLVLKQIIRTCFVFIWGSKMERLKRIFMIKPPEKGGKGMVDIKRFLYTKYLILCLKNYNSDNYWSFFIQYSAGFIFKRHGWCVLSLKNPVCFSPSWFYEILRATISDFNLQNKSMGDLLNKLKMKQFFYVSERMIPI
uniref:Reverse transcriptase domain-containing protein n=1 Tax=Xenopus tropicalis TaxID=8364 RepID=A0A803K7Y7_XENTR